MSAKNYRKAVAPSEKELNKRNLKLDDLYPIEQHKIWELEHWLGFPLGGNFTRFKSNKTGEVYDKDYFPDAWKKPLKPGVDL
jgi:hypothetical protein